MTQTKPMIVLFDYDSMIYKALHKVASIADIKQWFRDARSREWMETEIMNLAINRLSNMGDGILCEIEDTGIDIEHCEYFMTACSNSIRKSADPNYKAKRKKNKWVSLVRKELIKMNFAEVHEQWEADDLIKERAVEIGVERYVICSIDKDLKQIPGIHFDYYRPPLPKNIDGSDPTDENGHRIISPCRGLSSVTEEEADRFFWKQMLMGDSGDNIKGIPGIGKVKAKAIVESTVYLEITVRTKYIEHFGEEEGLRQFELHRLLIGLGINNRP